VTDTQIEFFAEIFGIKAGSLFPGKRRLNNGPTGLEVKIVTRRRRKSDAAVSDSPKKE
jgi:hypothetical protein